jgi:tetratricopeptide (TPR) repeat protein
MPSFSRYLRNRLPAISLGMVMAFGAVGASSIILAPAAIAQAKVNEKLGPVLKETVAALNAKNWSLAQQKIDAAAPLAKTGQEKVFVEQMRFNLAQGKGDKQALLKSTEALIDQGVNVAALKKTLPGLYEATGQSAKALQLLKANVDAGGGSASENFQVAAASAKAKNYSEALKYGNKAISMSGAKPPEAYLKLVAGVYKDTSKDAEYLGIIEKLATLYPKEDYWNVLFVRIQKEPTYKSDYKLDLFRLRQAAKIKLSPAERKEMGTAAIYKQLQGEAVKVLTAPDGDKALLAQAEASAARDKAGLAAEEAASAASGRGPDMIRVAEKAMGYGDNAKAIDLFQKGLAKPNPDAAAADYARLHLGIAQFNAGKKADAQATWATIKTDGSAMQFAKHWTLVSKS